MAPTPRTLLTPEGEARQAAENGFRQFDRLREMIREGIAQHELGRFQLRVSMLSELARLAVEGTVDGPGHLRRGPITIGDAKHTPPPSHDLMRLLEEMCDYVNSNFGKTAWHLAAYVMWRLNWIHPFEDGNGRTSRAASYLILCVRLKLDLPGTPTVPELIARDMAPYYQGLEAADQAATSSRADVDVSEMEALLHDLLIKQVNAAAGGAPPKFAIKSRHADALPCPSVDIGIITIRQDEEAAILARIKTSTIPSPSGDTHRQYHVGTVNNRQIAVIRLIQPGNVESAVAVRDMLEDFKLSWILLVGIAGTLPSDEYSLGDVVVSSRIYDFCIEAKLSGRTELAVHGGPLHPAAESVVAALSGRSDLPDWSSASAIGHDRPTMAFPPQESLYGNKGWQQKVRESIDANFRETRNARLWIGPVASSDKLVKSASLAKRWKADHRDVSAVEMEAAGAYSAAQKKEAKLIVIRGISDVVGLKRDPVWTQFACHSAAAFTYALLQSRALI